jgi:hypothetical protein
MVIYEFYLLRNTRKGFQEESMALKGRGKPVIRQYKGVIKKKYSPRSGGRLNVVRGSRVNNSG